jgi:hypothetical protein
MKALFISCLAAIPLIAVTGCASEREQPVSTTTTTSEENTVSQPVQSATTETTVQKN